MEHITTLIFIGLIIGGCVVCIRSEPSGMSEKTRRLRKLYDESESFRNHIDNESIKRAKDESLRSPDEVVKITCYLSKTVRYFQNGEEVEIDEKK